MSTTLCPQHSHSSVDLMVCKSTAGRCDRIEHSIVCLKEALGCGAGIGDGPQFEGTRTDCISGRIGSSQHCQLRQHSMNNFTVWSFAMPASLHQETGSRSVADRSADRHRYPERPRRLSPRWCSTLRGEPSDPDQSSSEATPQESAAQMFAGISGQRSLNFLRIARIYNKILYITTR